MNPMSLQQINALDRAAFVAALGRSFEHSPWVAEAAWAGRPFRDLDELHAAMMAVVRQAPRATQLAFLRAHPELAGKEAQAGTMTGESVSEQASAGLDALSPGDFKRLRQLNAAYRARHGFPFIIAARRHGKAEILAELERRTGLDSEAELQEALAQIAAITRLRVDALARAD
ncbi:2-oxo-4-hydroxy-4-carboxy-5-ureidoimidazoline decarboxylase [Azohydromonas caseinilytica]|uniref:2-oxo-4-hydroxy-4-carboxy-5-ureidoimidazoline decarboxylase n=1 Tax=Azohydromonas caseinilytica TaxID=2728836 RepID=A0A848FH90_9BURK|nr:2-oxo-4-hydroxy-4-carboxy-5-ureidoimidazoline decarboxylase [Azohydromonas caseinilytica]NML17211.1 2-oxo-4-hydroxy-4-carboxy-5-ureidoimidazoline decarboxylase [Azohydromonas caseinilytica]